MAKPHSGIQVRSDSRPPNFTPLTHSVLLGRVVILRSSEARVLRPIDSLARRQNVTFSNLWVRVEDTTTLYKPYTRRRLILYSTVQ